MRKLPLSCLALCASLSAASNVGKISGTVLDATSSRPAAGINVVVPGTVLGATTDGDGRYIIHQVPPGDYTVRAQGIGFHPSKPVILHVSANRTAYADFSLQTEDILLGAVEVAARYQRIERDNVATARVMTGRELSALPVSRVSDAIRLGAGAVLADGLHLRGGRAGEIQYVVDGIPLLSPVTGQVDDEEVINPMVVSEVQVTTGTYEAEYGNAMSGIVNLTTEDGGEEPRMELEVRTSSAALDSNSRDQNEKRIRFAASRVVAGTSFSLALEQGDADTYLPWGFHRDSQFFGKISRRLGDFRLSLLYQQKGHHEKEYNHYYKHIPEQDWYEPREDSRSIGFGITHTVSPTLYHRFWLYRQASHTDMGQWNWQDVEYVWELDENGFYVNMNVDTYDNIDQATVGAKWDLLWQRSSVSEVKVGGEARLHELTRFFLYDPTISPSYKDDYTMRPYEGSAYFQHRLDLASLILTTGVRFDLHAPNTSYWAWPYDAYDGVDSTQSKSHTQVSPRLGISFPITESSVFHFGYGHYFQRPPYEYMYRALASDNPRQNVIDNLLYGWNNFGNPDLKPEKTVAYEFGVSQEIQSRYLVNVSVYSKRITQLLGTRTYYPGGDRWEQTTHYINEDFAHNSGIEVSLERFGEGPLSWEFSYTFAVAEGSSSVPLQRYGAEEEAFATLKFFPLDFDQRHTANGWVRARFFGAEASLVGRYGSGLPYTPAIRGASIAYEINSERMPATFTLDLHAEYPVKIFGGHITPYLDVLNLTDRRNVRAVDLYTGKPDLTNPVKSEEFMNNPLHWEAPRLIYVGMRVGL